MRPIDADALLAKMIHTNRYFDIKFDIEEAPTIEAEPVKHGRWENTTEFFPWQEDDGLRRYRCSVCGKRVTVSSERKITDIFPYCNCGARMDGDEDV